MISLVNERPVAGSGAQEIWRLTAMGTTALLNFPHGIRNISSLVAGKAEAYLAEQHECARQEGEPSMPLVRIAMPKGKAPEYRKAVSAGVQRALVETFNVPPDDLFQIITEHGPGAEIVRASSYLGIVYTDDLTIIQLTVSDTRNVEQKKNLFRRIVELLAAQPGLRRQDVFINLVEVKKENWSFGNGEAQYAWRGQWPHRP